MTLKQQRDDIARKQYLNMEKMAVQAEKQRAADKKKAKSAKTKKNKTQQLSELRDWIEEQIDIEDSKPLESYDGSPKKGRSIFSENTMKMKGAKNSDIASIPGNNMMSLEDEKKVLARDNRYGLQGDNGYSDIVNE